jgi:GxxExxY protein
LDVVVEEKVILELKTVERLMPIHEAQMLTYLKLSGIRTGLLLNFNTAVSQGRSAPPRVVGVVSEFFVQRPSAWP